MTNMMLKGLILAPCAAVAAAWGIIWAYRILLEAFEERHAFRRHEKWKEDVLSAFRR